MQAVCAVLRVSSVRLRTQWYRELVVECMFFLSGKMMRRAEGGQSRLWKPDRISSFLPG
jgi:hypothetical protein